MRALLDVSALVALFDGGHALHDAVGSWFEQRAEPGWATYALTENGVVRVLSQPAYPNAVSASAAVALLRGARQDAAHEFWPCDVSLADPAVIKPGHLLGHQRLTDVYLLALAVRHGGCFVTLDRRLTVSAVAGATEDHLVVLP